MLTNPILLLTVLGVICSFAFGGQLPEIIATFLKTLGSAFSATALFLLGLRMVNKMDHFKGAKIIAPLILVALKLIAMPLIAREVVRFVQLPKPILKKIPIALLEVSKTQNWSALLIETCFVFRNIDLRREINNR